MNSFKLSILAPGNPFFNGECLSLLIPTTDGKYGILAHHANTIVTVVPGVLEYTLETGEKKKVMVSKGLLKCENNEALILVDSVRNS